MRYSATTGCFYPKTIEYASLPGDAIDVSIDDYVKAMSKVPGETVKIVDGVVTIIEPTVTFLAEQAAIVQASLIDIPGFIQDLKIKLGGIVNANHLYAAYPLLIPAMETGRFDDATALIKDAESANRITNDQYAVIKASASEFHIPIEL